MQIAVLTTIQEPTYSVCSFAGFLNDYDARLIVVGDKKGPASYPLGGVEFLSLDDQLKSEFDLARKLPTGHYSRKNVGYLNAVARGASCIYETDDDNAPLAQWKPRAEMVDAVVAKGRGWVNVYRLFSGENIWPRGFPLDELIHSTHAANSAQSVRVRAPIQQGLVNNSPDVDAIWRLTLDKPFEFEQRSSVLLQSGAWCPFNTQSTWWFPLAYPLMYLPSFCSFRMTDIWRSFIAQRCLWELDLGVVFHSPEVIQERNEHDLMRDFQDELPGYLRNKELAATLDRLSLAGGAHAVSANLVACYEELIKAGFFPEKEIELVNAWLADLEAARTSVCADVRPANGADTN